MTNYEAETFEDEMLARNFAYCVNWRLGEMQPSEKDIIGFLHTCFPNCMSCGEFGMDGRIMNCGFECLAPVYDEKHDVWRLARERCMIRTWIEILEVDGINPMKSEFGVSNELHRQEKHYA